MKHYLKLLNQTSRNVRAINTNPNSTIEIELTEKDTEKGIIQIELKDTQALRSWYASGVTSSLALFIDEEETTTHINSGFVVRLETKDNF